jgi:hypothetical protein
MVKEAAEKTVGVAVSIKRRVEVWRKGKLIAVDESPSNLEDYVVNAGLDGICGCVFDGTGNRPAAFRYIAIGTNGDPPSAGQTALGQEVMRIQGTYTKSADTGVCVVEGTFTIDGSYGLMECGLFNASSGGTMLCRDVYSVKNVIAGDFVKITYTATFSRVA